MYILGAISNWTGLVNSWI